MIEQTPKQEAKELVDKFRNLTLTFEDQKQCAFIVINELMLYIDDIDDYEFYEQVKEEIKNL